MVTKIKTKITNDLGISTVIGVILMVAVTIAMAAVAYAYFTGMIGGQTGNTPVISLTSENSDHNVTLTLADVTETNIDWRDVWFTLVDKTNQTQWQNTLTGSGWEVSVGISRTGFVTGGQLISIRTKLTGALTPSTPLIKDHNYQFTLTYNQTGGTMSVAEWTQ